jgi:gliding motility-associated-like protein
MQAVSPAMAGTYTLVVTDENNCKNSTTTLVDIMPLPDGSLVNFKDEFCVPYCATYNFVGSNSTNIQSTWQINGTGFASNKFNYCFKEAGTFTLSGKLVDNTTSCKSTLQYIITTHEKPFADFNFLPKEPIENLDEVRFSNLSEGTGFLSYHWYFNDNNGFSTTAKNTSYMYSEPGDYRVALVTKNNWGCADTVLKTIVVAPDFALYVPNTFTPNDDNRNDVFFASVRSSKFFDLKIYDRWGQEIFHATSPQDGWDGTFKGEVCKQDTYTWVIELSTVGGERFVKSGTVLLLR